MYIIGILVDLKLPMQWVCHLLLCQGAAESPALEQSTGWLKHLRLGMLMLKVGGCGFRSSCSCAMCGPLRAGGQICNMLGAGLVRHQGGEQQADMKSARCETAL